jgi:hypothetical protein
MEIVTPVDQHSSYFTYAELGGGTPTHTQGPGKKPKLVDPTELPAESRAASAELWAEQPSSPAELDVGSPQRPKFDTHLQPHYP